MAFPLPRGKTMLSPKIGLTNGSGLVLGKCKGGQQEEVSAEGQHKAYFLEPCFSCSVLQTHWITRIRRARRNLYIPFTGVWRTA